MRRFPCRLVILVALLTASLAFATKIPPPERHSIYSRNRRFLVDVDPQTGLHGVYDLQDPTKRSWSAASGDAAYPGFVSEDGEVVVAVASEYVREDKLGTVGIWFWNRHGEFRSYRINELCPDPPKVERRWHDDTWRAWYNRVTDHGDSFTIHTTRGVEYRFRFADGEIVDRVDDYWGLKICGLSCAGALAFLTSFYVGVGQWSRWRMRRRRQL
jgi:hypothetical protein